MADVKRCVSCGEEINARSELCVYCGAEQRPRREVPQGSRESDGPRRLPWFDTQAMAQRVAEHAGSRSRGQVALIATVAVLVVIGIAVLIGGRHPAATTTLPQAPRSTNSTGSTTTTGASPASSRAAGSSFELYRGSNVVAFVPQGWRRNAGAPDGEVSFSDPSDPRRSFSFALTRPAGVSLRTRAGALAAQSGAPPGSTSLVHLPGGRGAYRIAFEHNGVAHALYVAAACGGDVGVEVSVQAPGTVAALLNGPLDALAPAVAPDC